MTVEKRPAFESPAVLVAPAPVAPVMKRPTATVFGAILVVCRVVAGIVWLISLAVLWRRVLIDDLGLALDSDAQAEAGSNLALLVVLVVGGIVLAVQLVLALLIYRGSNWARITVMVFATLSITWSAFDYFATDTEITLRTTLITLALDILVLLALSSRAARAYARRPRSRPRDVSARATG
ncbi:hypothetical protein [Agromyces badenianii]|uniref:hypothetical protein n=1 Tax=Agromyces badenianii TaxID=2080742 RepID=UPI000D595600|nr:hypothetical protein [Agromyces badenianii]PWC05748.1 hypothetical protein DCE94_05750 [Agromyces badenianii]